jgi:hypothetical protein
MPTILAGATQSIWIPAGSTLTIGGGGNGTIQTVPPAVVGPVALDQIISVDRKFGPYSVSIAVNVVAQSPITYSIDTQATAAGGVVQSGIVSATIASLGAWGQMPDGRYLTADFFPGAGRGRQSLALYAGDPAAPFVQGNITSLVNTRAGDTGVLKTAAGVNLNITGAYVYCAWPASNGDIFFVAVEGGNFYHLYRCKAGTFTVGSDAGVTNGNAVLSLGMIGGTQTDQNRILTQRSFCEAKVNGATHYFIGEYNVSSGRVTGAAKDAVRVYRSTDGGTTWATFLEWNTDLTHQVDHVHFIKQDPYTGWIYIVTGDVGAQNMIIAYNGTGATVAANATPATIAATAGYKVINNSELCRYTDFFFAPDCIYSIPDADTEASDVTSTAYVSTRVDRSLQYVSTIGPVDRVNNVPPILGLQTAQYGDFFMCFCAALAFPTYPFADIFGSDYRGGTWTRIAKIGVRSGGFVSRAMWMDNQGRIWIYSDANTWIGTDADFDGSSKTRSLVLIPGPRGSSPFVWNRT